MKEKKPWCEAAWRSWSPSLPSCRFCSSPANSSALTAASRAKCCKCPAGAPNTLWYLPFPGCCVHTEGWAISSTAIKLSLAHFPVLVPLSACPLLHSPECWCLSRAVHSLCLKAETLRGNKELLKLGSSIGCINPHNIEWEFKSECFPKVQLQESWHVHPGGSLRRRQVLFWARSSVMYTKPSSLHIKQCFWSLKKLKASLMASLPSHGCRVAFRAYLSCSEIGRWDPSLHWGMLIGSTELWTLLLWFQAVLWQGHLLGQKS